MRTELGLTLVEDGLECVAIVGGDMARADKSGKEDVEELAGGG